MKKERWLKWCPDKEVPPTFWLIDYKYSEGILTLDIQDQINKSLPIMSIIFNNFLSMRITDEGDLLKDDCDLDESLLTMEKQPEYYYRWSLFTVENSHYTDWFCKEILDKDESKNILHYVVKNPNEVIEVLDLKDHNPILKIH